MSLEFGISFSMCFLKAHSLFEGSVLRVHLNPEVCKVVTPGAARFRCRCWRGTVPVRGRGGGLWSQVLQGFLSLLRVTVITVGVGPLAKGLLDVHVPLRVGQTLLVSGEEAKPFWKRKKEMRPGPLLCTVEVLPCQDIQQQMWKEANQLKV